MIAESLAPSAANQVTDIIVTGLETVGEVSPAVLVMGGLATAGAYLHGKYTNNGLGEMLAREPDVPQKSSRFDRIRSIGKTYAGVVGVTMAAIAFSSSAENAVRTGQVQALKNFKDLTGLKHDSLLITQGGVDTPMDTSYIDSEVAEELGMPGFYVMLPKIRHDNETVDGLAISFPSGESDQVTGTSLVGAEEGQTIYINGLPVTLDEKMPDESAAMRREVLFISNDIAEEVMSVSDEDNYFGLVVPSEDIDQADLQAELDAKYGEQTYTALTVEQFIEGTEDFMANNGTAILALTMLVSMGAGTLVEASRARDRVHSKTKSIATMKAIGADNSQLITAEVARTAYNLIKSAPFTYVLASATTKLANYANPGLGAELDVKNLATAFVVVSAPALAATRSSAKKIINGTSLTEAMKSNN